jgi:hypothetical protein
VVMHRQQQWHTSHGIIVIMSASLSCCIYGCACRRHASGGTASGWDAPVTWLSGCLYGSPVCQLKSVLFHAPGVCINRLEAAADAVDDADAGPEPLLPSTPQAVPVATRQQTKTKTHATAR